MLHEISEASHINFSSINPFGVSSNRLPVFNFKYKQVATLIRRRDTIEESFGIFHRINGTFATPQLLNSFEDIEPRRKSKPNRLLHFHGTNIYEYFPSSAMHDSFLSLIKQLASGKVI
eukprot:g76765.t1